MRNAWEAGDFTMLTHGDDKSNMTLANLAFGLPMRLRLTNGNLFP
jgi:hypothetical protein